MIRTLFLLLCVIGATVICYQSDRDKQCAIKEASDWETKYYGVKNDLEECRSKEVNRLAVNNRKLFHKLPAKQKRKLRKHIFR